MKAILQFILAVPKLVDTLLALWRSWRLFKEESRREDTQRDIDAVFSKPSGGLPDDPNGASGRGEAADVALSFSGSAGEPGASETVGEGSPDNNQQPTI